jgi:hypothetical protein
MSHVPNYGDKKKQQYLGNSARIYFPESATRKSAF